MPISLLKKSFKGIFYLLLLMWVIFALDKINDYLNILGDFTNFGIRPRTLIGIPGIIFATFLRGGLFHLISNSIPLFILGYIMLYFYPKTSVDSIIIIILLGGFLVWAFGRSANHIGSSLLIFGIAGFIIGSGIFRKQFGSIILAIIVSLIYGSTLFWGMVPTLGPISWESHLFGALAGVLAAYIHRKRHS